MQNKPIMNITFISVLTDYIMMVDYGEQRTRR